MHENTLQFEEQQKEKTLEQITHYQIWTNNFLEGLNSLKDSVDDVDSPESLMTKIGFGYEQYSRILNEIFGGKVGEMAMDMERLVKEGDSTINIDGLWKYIPFDLINKIENFRKTRNKSDIPTKAELEIAIKDVQFLARTFDRIDTTK